MFFASNFCICSRSAIVDSSHNLNKSERRTQTHYKANKIVETSKICTEKSKQKQCSSEMEKANEKDAIVAPPSYEEAMNFSVGPTVMSGANYPNPNPNVNVHMGMHGPTASAPAAHLGPQGYMPTYGSFETTPVSVVLQPPPITVPPEIIVIGGCPACRIGFLEDSYSCLGLLCAIAFFPVGILCCLAMKTKRCTNCNTELF